MHCPECGEEVRDIDRYCPRCGSEIERTLVSEQQKPGKHPPEPPRSPAAGPVAQRTSGFAIASLVLGILGYLCLFGFGSVMAIIFGLLAKRDVKRGGGMIKGSGMATAGIVLGSVLIGLLLVSAAVLVPLTFIYLGPTRTVSRSVSTAGAERVKASIEMDSGNLDLSGGASKLLEGEFHYNVKKWRPQVDYRVSDREGMLEVRQPGGWVPMLWIARNDWDLSMSNDIPLELGIDAGGADCTLRLNNLDLTAVDLVRGSGYCDLDISGEQDSLRSVRTLQSSGDLSMDLEGYYPVLGEVDIESSSGDIDLRMTGGWNCDVFAGVRSGSGDVRVALPPGVGIYVKASTGSGDISVSGLREYGADSGRKTYVSEEYGESTVTLRLDLSASSGDIRLAVRE